MMVTNVLYSRVKSLINFFQPLLIAGCLLMLLGCREYKLYHYEKLSDDVLGGELRIEATASRTLSKENGKKIAVEGNPYTLQFKFLSEERFKQINVEELVLVGLESGNQIKLSGASSLEARPFPETSKYFAIAIFSSQLEGVELKYEEYNLKAVLYLQRLDGQTEESHLNYTLKTKYKSESRSDIIDGMMGI